MAHARDNHLVLRTDFSMEKHLLQKLLKFLDSGIFLCRSADHGNLPAAKGFLQIRFADSRFQI